VALFLQQKTYSQEQKNATAVFKPKIMQIKSDENKLDGNLTLPTGGWGDEVIVCVSGALTNSNTKTQWRAFFSFSTLEPGFERVHLQVPQTSGPSVWSQFPAIIQT
jgi:hypothetical protein